MTNVNENKEIEVKIVKHFIKDLSFENPQNFGKCSGHAKKATSDVVSDEHDVN